MARCSTDSKTINLRKVIGLIVTVNLVVFIFLSIADQLLPDSEFINELFLDTDDPDRLWPLATYSFCHISFSHLMVNMTVLIIAALIIEKRSLTIFSAQNVALIYFASALGGGVAFLISTQNSNVLLGASAAVMGLAGALALACYKTWITIPFPGRLNVMWLMFILIAWILVATSTSSPETTIVHAAGFVTGIIAYAIISLIRHCKFIQNRLSQRYHFNRLNLKVRTSGYASLNEDERYFLSNHSQNLQ